MPRELFAKTAEQLTVCWGVSNFTSQIPLQEVTASEGSVTKSDHTAASSAAGFQGSQLSTGSKSGRRSTEMTGQHTEADPGAETNTPQTTGQHKALYLTPRTSQPLKGRGTQWSVWDSH